VLKWRGGVVPRVFSRRHKDSNLEAHRWLNVVMTIIANVAIIVALIVSLSGGITTFIFIIVVIAVDDIVVVVMEWNQSAHGSMYSICCCHPTLTCSVRVSASARDSCRSHVQAAATVGKTCRRL
jgi:hypothetical protein